MVAWKIADDRITLPYRAGTVTCDKTCGNMDQCGPFHAPREGYYVLGANHVGAQRAFQSRVERDISCAIDHYVDIVGDSLCLLVAVAEIHFANVAAENHNLVT